MLKSLSEMHKFARNLLSEWRKLKLPVENENIIVAVSGGADSVSLLLAVADLRERKKLNLNFIVAHFNHDLRGAESLDDAKFVEDLATNLKLTFIGSIQNPKSKIQSQTGNLEQSARIARYEFLSESARNYGAFAVLTAHTLNDQAETFLLNLIRGSGAAGLGAMCVVRKLNENEETLLVRPLLSWAKRADTENFALEKGCEFRIDAMNENTKFSRVQIRKNLIPLLAADYNPKIIERLAKTAFLLQEENGQSPVVNYQLSVNPSVQDLKNLAKGELYDFLRKWMKQQRGNLRRLESRHFEAIERLVNSRKSGRTIELPGGEIVIKRHGKLVFEKTKVEKSRSDN